MFKHDFNGGGLSLLCDKCRRVIVTGFNFHTGTVTWEVVSMKPRTQGASGIKMNFCDEKCRIIFFRGKKYYQRKLLLVRTNWS